MSIAGAVENWFGAHIGGSLCLPDGWHGRPYDNQHILTSISESGDGVTIILDGTLVLKFGALQAVRPTDQQLTLGPFSQLRFEWEESGLRMFKTYEDGEVKIILPPG